MHAHSAIVRRIPILLAVLAVWWGLTGEAFPVERLPAPDATQQAEVESLLREIFGRDWDSRDAERRMEVARQLLAQGEDVGNDAATRFVSLRESARHATEAGEYVFALTALDLLDGWFRAETSPLRMEVLARAQRVARDDEAFLFLAEAYLGVVAGALQEDQYEIARTALQRAGTAAMRVRERELANHARSMMPMVREAEQRYAAVAAAKVTLQARPDDPQANLLLGRHEALGKGNWGTGLPYLAKAGSDPVAAVAQTDLADPQVEESIRALADAWYDLAQAERDEIAKAGLLQRAAYHYKRIVDELSGLQQVMAKRRIQEAEDAAAAHQPLAEIPAARTLRISVVEARYGTDGRWADVTEQAKAALDPATGFSLPASNGMAGRDPAGGVVKRMEVTFQWGRGTWVETVREGETLELSLEELREKAREAQRTR